MCFQNLSHISRSHSDFKHEMDHNSQLDKVIGVHSFQSLARRHNEWVNSLLYRYVFEPHTASGNLKVYRSNTSVRYRLMGLIDAITSGCCVVRNMTPVEREEGTRRWLHLSFVTHHLASMHHQHVPRSSVICQKAKLPISR